MPAEPRGDIEASSLWFTAPRTAELRQQRVPPPGPGEVRARSIASAISHGTEMLVYRGEVPPDLPLDLPTFAGSFALPIKYGYATVGRILDTGADVRGLEAGDMVFVHHPHQDVFAVPADMPVPLPTGLDPVLGVFAANLETALNIVHDAHPLLGEAAVVFGQGTVGILVAQLLRLAGAGRVLAVEPLERRRKIALETGADEVLEPGRDLPERIRAANSGRAPDLAIEVSGSGAALQSAVDSVATEGTVIAASWYGTKPVDLMLGGHFHRGRVRLRSSQVGSLSPEAAPRWDRRRRMETAMSLLLRLHLKELISHRFPFEESPEAYRLLDERPAEVVQVVLVYQES